MKRALPTFALVAFLPAIALSSLAGPGAAQDKIEGSRDPGRASL